MRLKPWAGVLLVTVAGLTVWGALTLNEKLQCQSLEDEYLNTMNATRQAILIRGLAPDSEALARVSEGLVEPEYEEAGRLLPLIYELCGERAGRTAFRKGSRVLLGY
mgnify:CR=1 FL=1